MKKQKFPNRLLAVKLDDGTIIVHDTPEEIGDDFADDAVGVYELITVGKFSVEKSVSGKPPETINERILDNASHEEMASYVQKIGLKLYTKNMSTKELRKHLREYLSSRKKR